MENYVAKFYDSETRPPRGGWSVAIEGRDFSGGSENDVRSKIKQWRMNNGTFTSDNAIVAEIWAVWVAREPERQLRHFPNFATSIVNAARAAGRVVVAVATGKPIAVAQSELARRKAICDCCTLLDLSQGADNPRCAHCTCPLNYKLALTTERCPIGKF